MALFDDLSGKISGLTQAVTDLKTQIQTSGTGTGGGGGTADPNLSVTADQATQLSTGLDNVSSMITQIKDSLTSTTAPPTITPTTGPANPPTTDPATQPNVGP